jgi:hypothetical protein
VPVAATVASGRLVVCAKGLDNQLYLNELGPGGRGPWTGWQPVPGGGQTNVAPALAAFQEDLYVFIKELTSGRILTKARSAEGEWTNRAEVPGRGVTDQPIAAVSAGQLHLFVKGVADRRPYSNVASSTGSWSGWSLLPTAGTTDAALAAGAIQNRLYLFAKGVAGRQLYVRSGT